MPYAVNEGVRIHYRIEGEGEPLVLQHGFTDSLETWYELGYVEALKPQHRLILIDARGHGTSDKPHQPEASEKICAWMPARSSKRRRALLCQSILCNKPRGGTD